MNGKVGFRDDHDAADTEGAELVKDQLDNGGLGPLGRLGAWRL
jgi:hypothetical protein